MSRLTTITIDKDYLKFSAAHFTVFSASERERLHGHNFKVSASFVAEVGANGMCVDYSFLKRKVLSVCAELDEYTLIAGASPYLEIAEQDAYYRVQHGDDVMLLLQSDTLILPVANTTVEEYSYYILQRIIADEALFSACEFHQVDIWVSSGPGQQGMSRWSKSA